MNASIISKKIILASKSPRRQELMRGLDIPFEIRTKEVNEDFPKEMPHKEVAKYLAEKKATFYYDELSAEELLITSDTTVLIDGAILNKPRNRAEAIQMLQLLSGKVHEVVTGVCMMDKNKKISFDDLTEVHFKPLSEDEINDYIDRYQPFDKAGAYGVQEWIGYVAVYKMIGSFYNVMGLPVHRVYEELKKW